MRKKILLLYGGFSAEKDVSISSEKDIAAALRNCGHQVIEHCLTDVWQFLQVLKEENPDVVYNGLYGNWGEDGELQGLLDMLQIPYTHSGLSASAIGMNKYLCKIIAAQNGIKIADGEKKTFAEYLRSGSKVAYPHVIKPVSDGSSVGVYIIRNKEDALKATYGSSAQEILIEKYIPGRELTVMCLNGKTYAVTELQSQKGFYDYEAKYTDGITAHILPADIPDDVAVTCRKYAAVMHNVLNCNTLSRCDFRYNPDDGVVFLEINTNPGMTSLSLVPEQAKYAGISYAELCDMMVKNATCRKR